jgi:hypothetical protein
LSGQRDQLVTGTDDHTADLTLRGQDKFGGFLLGRCAHDGPAALNLSLMRKTHCGFDPTGPIEVDERLAVRFHVLSHACSCGWSIHC